MHLSRLGPDRNGFRDRMFGREPYPPPPPPPFLRDRMMGRFGVRVSFWNMEHYKCIHQKMSFMCKLPLSCKRVLSIFNDMF
jgi:hypothetical protein